MESGLIAFGQDGQPVRELRPGGVFFGAAGETVRRSDSLCGSEPAAFIAFCLIRGGQPLIQPIS